MPKIHNPDWNSLKLSDFPQFKCLCELCDCGCFERSKKKHTQECKKFVSKISDAFESKIFNPEPFDAKSLYSDTFKKYDYKPPTSDTNQSIEKKPEQKIVHIQIPIKYGPRESNIELPDKDVKFSSRTTNKDHFKSWHAPPAKAIPEYPEFTSRLIYRDQKRDLLTTNEELFRKNYGKFKAHSSAMNIFENTFKISQGKMNLDTVYTHDYHKINIKDLLKERGPTMTKELVENRNKKIIERIPMDTKTQTMVDYSYDPDTFHTISKKNKEPYPVDLFRSKLTNGLKPVDNEFSDENTLFESNYNISFRDKTNQSIQENSRSKSEVLNPAFGQSHLTHNKNIRYINTIDNRMVPSLKVIKKISNKPRKATTASTDVSSSIRSSVNLENLTEEELANSTYKVDYKDRGIDVCMAKAYSLVANKPINTN